MAVIVPFNGRSPRIAESAFVAPTAAIIGDVEIGEGAGIWFGAVLRADFGPIRIGPGCNIQDNAVLHSDANDGGLVLEERVTVGHAAIVHGSLLGKGCLIGMGAIVLNGCKIGAGAFIAAASVVRANCEIPPHTLAAGNPAVVKKCLEGAAADWVATAADDYLTLSRQYK